MASGQSALNPEEETPAMPEEQDTTDWKTEREVLKAELSESRSAVLNLEAKVYMLEGVGKLRKGAIVRLEKILENLHLKNNYMKEQLVQLHDFKKQQEDLNEFLNKYVIPEYDSEDADEDKAEEGNDGGEDHDVKKEAIYVDTGNSDAEDTEKELEYEDPKLALIASQLAIKQREMVTLRNMLETLKSEAESIEITISSLDESEDCTELKAYHADLLKSQNISKERIEQCHREIAKKEATLKSLDVEVVSKESYLVEDGTLLVKLKHIMEDIAEEERIRVSEDIEKTEHKAHKAKAYARMTIDALNEKTRNSLYKKESDLRRTQTRWRNVTAAILSMQHYNINNRSTADNLSQARNTIVKMIGDIRRLRTLVSVCDTNITPYTNPSQRSVALPALPVMCKTPSRYHDNKYPMYPDVRYPETSTEGWKVQNFRPLGKIIKYDGYYSTKNGKPII